MGEGFLCLPVPRAEFCRSRAIRPGGVGSKVAFLYPHSVDASSYEHPEAHEEVRGEPKRERVVSRAQGKALSVLKEQVASASLQASVGCSQHVAGWEAPSWKEEVGREDWSEEQP